MKTFRLIALLGLFAIAGVGVAIGVVLTNVPLLDASDESAAPAMVLAPQPAPPLVEPALLHPPDDLACVTPDELPNEAVEPPAAPTAPELPPSPPLPDGVAAMPGPELGDPSAEARLPVSNNPLRDLGTARTQPPQAAPVAPQPPYTQQAPTGGPTLKQFGDVLKRAIVQGQVAQAEPVPTPPPVPDAPEPLVGSAAASVPSPSQAQRSYATIDGEGDEHLRMTFHDEDIRQVLNMLSAQGDLNILAGKSVTGKVSATLTDVDVEGALDAILMSTGYVARRDGKFIFVGTPDDFNTMEQSLDKIGTRIYRPNYITAAELQALIQPLLSEKVGAISVSTPAESGIGSDVDQAGGDAFSGAEAVVVRDYEAVLAEVDQMVCQLDIRPLQVHIEAMILSVKLSDEDKYGVSFELLRSNPNVALAWGNPLSSLGDIKFEEGALKVGFLDSNLSAFLEALETVGDTNVIATPRLMVINKQRAEIQIGEQQGYVSTTITETAASQSVEFLDTGAQLRLRPFIATDGLIRMEIHPELSDGSVEVKEGFTLPNKEVTQVTTNIMVRDGCTVIIGGLMREGLETTTSQVPVLGNLPGLGFMFRSSTEKTERREVLVLITPHIVYEPETCAEGEQAACEFFRRQNLYADKQTCFNKRNIARKYFRLAQAAWAAGDRDRALRFAEMSVHFDPLCRAAIDLRSDIWQGKPAGEHTLGAGDPAGPYLDVMDGDSVAPWILDGLEAAAPVHPRDPGRPGTKNDILRPRRLR